MPSLSSCTPSSTTEGEEVTSEEVVGLDETNTEVLDEVVETKVVAGHESARDIKLETGTEVLENPSVVEKEVATDTLGADKDV